MKHLSILALCLFLFSCKSDPSSNNAQNKSADGKNDASYKSYDGKDRGLAFSHSFKTNKGTEYVLSLRGGEVDAAVHIKGTHDGKIFLNKEIQAFGNFNKAYMADLNNDGEEDLVFYNSLAHKSKIGYAYGAMREGDKGRILTVLPFLPKPYTDNYFGEDTFYIENNNVIKEIPKYVLNERRNKRPSGKNWKLTYQFVGSDTLKLVDGVEVDIKK